RVVPDIGEPQLLLTSKSGNRWVTGPFAELSKAKPPAVPAVPEVIELEPGSESLIRSAVKLGLDENSIRQAAKTLATLDGEATPRLHHVAEATQHLSPGTQERLEQAVRESPESLNAQEMLKRFRAVTEVVTVKPPAVEVPAVPEVGEIITLENPLKVNEFI
ncbi:unnamed protein product, partial [marine sediment metagenome]